MDPSGRPAGKPRIAIDTVGSGVGDRVLIVDEGNSARQVLQDPKASIRTVIGGFVDRVEYGQTVTTTRPEM
ncbi:MAG: EutN/CcmL family microcompartment protein [Planctomycetota bacterium]